VKMIVAQREYQGNSQVLKIQVDMDLSLAKL
jgi:flagellar hook protein FlgE